MCFDVVVPSADRDRVASGHPWGIWVVALAERAHGRDEADGAASANRRKADDESPVSPDQRIGDQLQMSSVSASKGAQDLPAGDGAAQHPAPQHEYSAPRHVPWDRCQVDLGRDDRARDGRRTGQGRRPPTVYSLD